MNLDIGVGNKKSDYDIKMDVRKTKQTNLIGNIRNIPLKDESVELINCSHILEHLHEDDSYGVYEQTEALKEIYRVLKAKGKTIFKMPNGWQADNYDHKSVHLIRDWLMLFEKVGFKIISVRGTATTSIEGTNRILNVIIRYISRHKWFIGLNSEFTVWCKK